MDSFLESLESRTFLSASPSVAALTGEARIVAADLKAVSTAGTVKFRLIEVDLKAAGELKSSKGLLKALENEGAAAFKVLDRGVTKTASLLKADVKRIEGAAAKLSKRPTNVELQSKVTAADNTLQTDATNRLATINTDITDEQTIDSGNVTALESANPGNKQLASDVTNDIDPRSSTARTALENAATTALTTDVAAVITAFPG